MKNWTALQSTLPLLILLLALGLAVACQRPLPPNPLVATVVPPAYPTTDGRSAVKSETIVTPAAASSPPTAAAPPEPTPLPPVLASAAVTPPAKAALPANWARIGVPILMYHYIRVNPNPADTLGYGLSIPPADFEAQMAFLAARGYRTVAVRDLASAASRQPGGKRFAITFDDGYADAYLQAFPVLRRYGFAATFYVITGLVGRSNYLTWDQVLALANGGMAIGSHTIDHVDLTRLSDLPLQRELEQSRAALEQHLGHAVLDFSYPSGRYNAAVVLAVGRAGYLTAVTTRPSYAAPTDDPMALPRVRVAGGMSLAEFASAMGEGPLGRPSAQSASVPTNPTPTPSPSSAIGASTPSAMPLRPSR